MLYESYICAMEKKGLNKKDMYWMQKTYGYRSHREMRQNTYLNWQGLWDITQPSINRAQARSDGAQHLHWLPLHHTLLQQKDFICTKSSSDTFNLALQPSIPTLSESQDRCAYFTIVNLLSDITPTLLPEPLCKMAYKSDHHGLHPYPGQFREDIVFSSNWHKLGASRVSQLKYMWFNFASPAFACCLACLRLA